VQNYSLVRSK